MSKVFWQYQRELNYLISFAVLTLTLAITKLLGFDSDFAQMEAVTVLVFSKTSVLDLSYLSNGESEIKCVETLKAPP